VNDVKGTGGVDKTQWHRNHWTIAELTFVEQHYGQLSVAEIGEKLDRTANAVITKASLLGLTYRGNWSQEEKDFLKSITGIFQPQRLPPV